MLCELLVSDLTTMQLKYFQRDIQKAVTVPYKSVVRAVLSLVDK